MKKDIRGPLVSIRGSIIPPFVYFVYFVVSFLPYTGSARRNCRAGAPTRANHALFPTFFSLPSTFGSPLQSGHALFPTFFSLPSTLVECECGCRDNDWECPDGDAWVVASCDSERHIFAL